MKVYQKGEAQTADEIIIEFDFMWSGQQVMHQQAEHMSSFACTEGHSVYTASSAFTPCKAAKLPGNERI